MVTVSVVLGVFGRLRHLRRLGCLRCFGRFGYGMRRGVRVGAVSGRGFAGRGRVSIVCDLVEEDVVLKGRAGLCVQLGIFGKEHFQPNSDSILMWKYGK